MKNYNLASIKKENNSNLKVNIKKNIQKNNKKVNDTTKNPSNNKSNKKIKKTNINNINIRFNTNINNNEYIKEAENQMHFLINKTLDENKNHFKNINSIQENNINYINNQIIENNLIFENKIINTFLAKPNISNVKKMHQNNKNNNIISKSNKISTMEKGNCGYSINPFIIIDKNNIIIEGKSCGSKEDSIKNENKNKILTEDNIKTMREIKKSENYIKKLSINKKKNQKTIIDKNILNDKTSTNQAKVKKAISFNRRGNYNSYILNKENINNSSSTWEIHLKKKKNNNPRLNTEDIIIRKLSSQTNNSKNEISDNDQITETNPNKKYNTIKTKNI